MSEPKTYSIHTVRDFLSVPPDRREVCIREFFYWCATADAMEDVARSAGIKGAFPSHFEWIDDDKHTLTATLKQHDGKRLVVAHGVMAEFSEKDGAP